MVGWKRNMLWNPKWFCDPSHHLVGTQSWPTTSTFLNLVLSGKIVDNVGTVRVYWCPFNGVLDIVETNVSAWGDFCPQAVFGVSEDISGCHRMGVATGIYWIESWDAVNILYCARQPSAMKNYLSQNEIKKTRSKRILPGRLI